MARNTTFKAGLARAGLVICAALTLTACGITAPRFDQGYADLDSLGVFDTDRQMSLSIGRLPIRIAIWALDEDGDEAADLLRGVEGVRIRIYEIDGDASRVAARIERMAIGLQKDDWQPVMLVRDDDELVHMLMRADDQQVYGLTLISSDGSSEAVVINIMGDLDPTHFSDAMAALDVDAPEVEVASTSG
ncbi:MAG: DUF4252 domain-containing protein [Xanthomonadales bacterium]|nr:DUF4252 domain-containing protein [Xanthomonadales bacterium]